MVPSQREPMSLPKVSINRKTDCNFASQFRESWFCLYIFNIIGDGLFRQNKQKQTKMSTELALVAAKALPALSGSSLTYNPEKNVYLLYQRSWQYLLSSHPPLKATGGVLPHWRRLCSHLPQRHHAVLLGWAESKDHRPEVLGRLQLEMLL